MSGHGPVMAACVTTRLFDVMDLVNLLIESEDAKAGQRIESVRGDDVPFQSEARVGGRSRATGWGNLAALGHMVRVPPGISGRSADRSVLLGRGVDEPPEFQGRPPNARGGLRSGLRYRVCQLRPEPCRYGSTGPNRRIRCDSHHREGNHAHAGDHGLDRFVDWSTRWLFSSRSKVAHYPAAANSCLISAKPI